MTYDCGDFLGVLKQALEMADHAGFKKRKRESKKRGKLRGFGVGCYLEVTAAPGKELGAIHFEDDGTVTIVTGTMDFGMGHATPFAQMLTDKLGMPFDRIRMVEGDSDRMAFGGGTGGSRSMMFVGAAIVEAVRSGDRARQADRLARAGSLGRRHRVQGRPLRHRRHRPLDRHHGTGAAPARRAEAAGRRRRHRSTSTMWRTSRCRRPSPTAATSPRSRSIPRPGHARW